MEHLKDLGWGETVRRAPMVASEDAFLADASPRALRQFFWMVVAARPSLAFQPRETCPR